MKVTLDTNILISGTFWEGDSFKILNKIDTKHIELVISEEILREYEEVLSYSEITNKISEKSLDIKFTIEKLKEMATIVKPSRKINIITEDPDDNAILECALEGKADFIITNDNHLLKLKESENIKILTPREFVLMLGN